MRTRSPFALLTCLQRKKTANLLLTLLSLLLLATCASAAELRQGNLFEQAGPGERRSWKEHGTLSTDSPGRLADSFSIKIADEQENDIQHFRRIQVLKGRYYRFSAWVKTAQVKGQVGANLAVSGSYNHSRKRMVGDTPWTYVEQVFRASETDQADFALRLGFWDSPASGTAWFSEVQLEELTEWPGPYQALLKMPPKAPRSSMPLRFFCFLIFVPWLVGFLYILRNALFDPLQLAPSSLSDRQTTRGFWLLLLSGLALRLLLASTEGMTNNLDLLRDLALGLGQPQAFLQAYTSGVAGQHPLLFNLYLAVVGALVRLGNWEISPLFTLLIKTPALLIDLAVGTLLFRSALKIGSRQALLLLTLFLFNPALLFSSVFWGQTAACTAGLLFFALYSLQKNRYLLAGLLIGALFSYSLQWPFLVAFFLLLAYLQGSFSQGLRATAGILISLLSVSLPLFLLLDLSSILGHFPATPGLPRLSLDAFNFWSLIGLNRQPAAEQLLGLSGTAWGISLAILLLLLLLVAALRARRSSAATVTNIDQQRIWALFALLSFGLFLFLPAQQEKDLLPSIFLLGFLALKNRRYAAAFWAISCLGFFNQILVFWHFSYRHSAPPADALYQPLGGALLLLTFLFLLFKEFSDKNATDQFSSAALLENSRIPLPRLDDTAGNGQLPPFAMRSYDWTALLLLWAMAAGLLLFDLGKMDFPVNGYQVNEKHEIFEIELESTAKLAGVGFYGGEIAPEVRFEYWDGEEWQTFWKNQKGFLIYPSGQDYRKTFKNKQRSFEPVATSRLRAIVRSKEATVLELALFGEDQRLLTPQKIRSEQGEMQAATSHAFFDEQGKIGPFRRYQTSTYWDEVFYARSAFDLLNGQLPYEKTHPPLGKTIIAWGIRLFDMTPFGWRVMPALAISLLPLLLFAGGRWLSGRRLVAYLAAALFTFECLAFSIGRMANIDGFLVLFQTAMLVALLRWFLADEGELRRGNLGWLMTAGVCFGLAVSIKWSAIFCGFAIFLLVAGWHICQLLRILRKKDPAETGQLKNYLRHTLLKNLVVWCGCFMLLPLVIYYLSHVEFLHSLADKPGLFSMQGIEAFWQQQKFILGFHGGKKVFDSHSLASPFYTWPILFKPVQEIFINSRVDGDLRSTISMVGNPAIFWCGLVAMLGWAWQALKGQNRPAIWLAAVYFLPFLPWILVQRPSFFYAYFPFVPVLVLGLATAAASVAKYQRILCAGLLFCSIALFMLFYPVISGLPMPKEYFSWLHWFDSWSKF